MTVDLYPLEYELNCIKIGDLHYGISMSIGTITLVNYTGCFDHLDNCPGTELDGDTNTIRYTVNITWDGTTVSSESISQLTTGDQIYQCVLDNPFGADRTRTLIIKGNDLFTVDVCTFACGIVCTLFLCCSG